MTLSALSWLSMEELKLLPDFDEARALENFEIDIQPRFLGRCYHLNHFL